MAKRVEPLIGRYLAAGIIEGIAFGDPTLLYEDGKFPPPDGEVAPKIKDLQDAEEVVNIRIRKDLDIPRILDMPLKQLKACRIPPFVREGLQGKKDEKGKQVEPPSYTARIGQYVDKHRPVTVPTWTKTFVVGKTYAIGINKALDLLRDPEAGRFLEEVDDE